VPQMKAADWKGGDARLSDPHRTLGLRVQSPDSADVSRASSIKNFAGGDKAEGGETTSREYNDDKEDSLKGVKRSGPHGERWSDDDDEPGGEKKTPAEKQDEVPLRVNDTTTEEVPKK
jgi:protein-tyrosine phosphatase